MHNIILIALSMSIISCVHIGKTVTANHNRNDKEKGGRLTRCEYTLIVQEYNESTCPIVQKNTENGYQRDDNSKTESTKDIMSNINGLQSQLIAEMRSTESIKKKLQQENEELTSVKNEVVNFKKMLKQLEEAVKKQEIYREKMRHNWKNVDYKLSNVVLDIIEINNNLNKQYVAQNKKEISVQSSISSTSCEDDINVTKYADCFELYEKGHKKNGVYYISNKYTGCSIPVYCDMKTAPGGWTVIQKRINGKLNFGMNWKDYKNGFGNVTHEYWLGNDNIFLLTSQKDYTLRIDLWDFKDSRVYAEYKYFNLDGIRDNYTLHVSNYSGTAGDSFSKHDNSPFSTVDKDNDVWPDYNCAEAWGGGWWFNDCWYVILNGPYFNDSNVEHRGISWNEWKNEQLKKSEMKIRPN